MAGPARPDVPTHRVRSLRTRSQVKHCRGLCARCRTVGRMQLVPVPDSPTDTTVDLVIIGAGAGMAAALAADELGLSTLIIEKTEYVGGSMALSGGAFWIPDNPV